jgi:hypothetical protein
MMSFDGYKGILPYASEIFGIYQPLLGWKSKIISRRYDRIRSSLYLELATRALAGGRSSVEVKVRAPGNNVIAPRIGESGFEVAKFAPVDLSAASERHVAESIDSGVARLIARELKPEPPSDWRTVIDRSRIDGLLEKLRGLLGNARELEQFPDVKAYVERFTKGLEPRTDAKSLLEEFFSREAKIAGYLLFLTAQSPSQLDELFYRNRRSDLLSLAKLEDPLLNFGANNYDAILSPIGIVHLYRQYFFEFDSFLGPPAGHVWLSPGGTVELIEVSTRRTLTEKSLEQSLETVTKAESEVTVQDDIAEAVKEENRNNTKLGFSHTGSHSSPIASETVTASFSLDHNQAFSRETTHKKMRQQSEKLSSEIKRNFKTTFKTTTEVTDTSSKRYVIQNTTNKLVNYELRRKMRKVGVQVQDIGVALCWHTFVDDPGRDLGIAKLVHIGEPPELSDLVQPAAPEMPTAKTQDANINIPFVGINTDDNDNDYTDGWDYDWGDEEILADFEQRIIFPNPGFTLFAVDLDPQGFDAKLSVRDLQSADGSSTGTFTIHLDYVKWNGKDSIPVKALLHWEPATSIRDALTAEYNQRINEYNIEKARRYKEAFYEAARERIKLASEITPRPAEELREEERTVVYRTLVSQLMSVGTHQSKHVISELIRSIFDVDRMLYFVAPEWWAPRLHRSAQQLGGEPGGGASPGLTGSMATAGFTIMTKRLPGTMVTAGSAVRGTPITSENLVDWGGARELGRDNYYITEESRPAKLGSSLGWLLQLDGDNLRNAFLNSPWVKAVIPIRIGKEKAALNWLEQAHVEGAEGLDAAYVAAPDDPPELQPSGGQPPKIRDALAFLIERIQKFDQASRSPILGNPAEPDDPRNHFAGSLPTEAVFEHGFYPLKGGVQFTGDAMDQSIFSQWMEILPTDQVAALEVEYDPKTLQVREPAADTP